MSHQIDRRASYSFSLWRSRIRWPRSIRSPNGARVNQGEPNELNHRDKPQKTTCSADKKPLLVRTAHLATCEPGTGQARNWAKTGIYGGHVYSLIHMIDGECILSPTWVSSFNQFLMAIRCAELCRAISPFGFLPALPMHKMLQIQVANDPMTKLQICFIHTRGDLPSRPRKRGSWGVDFHGRSPKKEQWCGGSIQAMVITLTLPSPKK